LFIDRCTILIDMAEGLCCRLYNAKKKFADPATNPSCLSSKELGKIRDKLEKNFPDSADLTKVCTCMSLCTFIGCLIGQSGFCNIDVWV
jgi:hypothetical protein